jgi:hypothetical protein
MNREWIHLCWNDPLATTVLDFEYKVRPHMFALHYAAEALLATLDDAEKAGYNARCAAHFTNIFLSMEI